jgi:non-heme chloroperoxidase
MSSAAPVTEREAAQVRKANESGRQPVVFVHGLWLLAESWDQWKSLFEERGYAAVAIDWPGDAESFEAAHANPDTLAGTSVPDVADHIAEVIKGLNRKPIVIGHSFGGLLVQIIAGRGLAAASVPIDPAPSQGVLPLPVSTLKSSLPVLGNPLNFGKTVTLTFDQFRYGFANAVSDEEARSLYSTFHTPAPGRPLFQAATANFNPWAKTKINRTTSARGPMLFITGGDDNIVPFALANAAFKKQHASNSAATEIIEIPGVGHSLVIDHGWKVVADAVLDFLDRHNLSD